MISKRLLNGISIAHRLLLVCCLPITAESYPAASVRLPQESSADLANSAGRRRRPQAVRHGKIRNRVQLRLSAVLMNSDVGSVIQKGSMNRGGLISKRSK